MTLEHVTRIEISDAMRQEAEKEAKLFEVRKNDINHVNPKGGNRHDYIGSLGHQAVEEALKQYGVDFESVRGKLKPDNCDIEIVTDNGSIKIDIKAVERPFKPHYINTTQFLVFQHQIDRGIIQKKDWLIFVLIDGDYAYIFGCISVSDFLLKGKHVGADTTDGRIKYDNWGINAYNLVPLGDFLR